MPRKNDSANESVEKKIHYRPFMHVIRKSPLEPLMEQAEKALEAVINLQNMLQLYTEERYDESDALFDTISRCEKDADKIEEYVREHMPKKLFMPIAREAILAMLREQDSIADLAEDIASLLKVHHTKWPQDVRDDMLKHNQTIVEAVENMQLAIQHVSDLLHTSFRRKDIDHILAHVHDVDKKEHEADAIKRRVRARIYGLKDEMDFLSIYHLLRVLAHQDYIANHAENVEDRLRTILAK